jgi:hypothetical protein
MGRKALVASADAKFLCSSPRIAWLLRRHSRSWRPKVQGSEAEAPPAADEARRRRLAKRSSASGSEAMRRLSQMGRKALVASADAKS